MTPLGLLLSNALNFTYGKFSNLFSNLSKNFLFPSSLRVQSYGDFLFLANFLINFIKN